MAKQTTTEAPAENGGNVVDGVPVDDQGQAIPQPGQADPAEAVEKTTEKSQEAPNSEEPSKEENPQGESHEEDNSTAKWLESKGIDPNSPEAVEKVAEMARNAEKAMHSKAQKASELEKAIDEGIAEEAQAQGLGDDERVKLARIETKLTVRDFFESNPDAKPYEQAMIAELQKKPHLAGDLESLYANAVVNSGSIEAVKSQGKKEALESLAHKQQAAVPTGSAVSSVSAPASITPDNVDELVAKNDLAWFKKNQEAINKAMAGIS